MKKSHSNLLKAIAGESMARNKYTYYAQIAAKEGWIWISKVFEETADNERAHAKEELEKLTELTEMTNTYDIHPLGTTLENLRHAAAGEAYEFGTMYPDFEKTAREENETEIAALFKVITGIESKHCERFTMLADMLESGTLYTSDNEMEWKCINCGHVHKGKTAPGKCPFCKKEQGWFMGLGVVR